MAVAFVSTTYRVGGLPETGCPDTVAKLVKSFAAPQNAAESLDDFRYVKYPDSLLAVADVLLRGNRRLLKKKKRGEIEICLQDRPLSANQG